MRSAPRPQFTELRFLGRGGMGEVHLALMQEGDAAPDLVALKRVRSEWVKDEEHLRHFEREAELGATLQHPNVVGLKAYGQDDRGPYLALEYVQGLTCAALLATLKAEGRILPVAAAALIAQDAARGLAYLHDGVPSGPILHRDISPDNLLLGYDGRVRVADLGVAREVDATRLTQTGLVRGKLKYIAPELFSGGAASTATDVYALGATLFELLTGVSPFTGKTDAELVYQICHQVPPRLSELRPDLPRALTSSVDGALERNPDLRPSASALESLASAFLASLQLTGNPLQQVLGAPPREELALTQLHSLPNAQTRTLSHAAPAPWPRGGWRAGALALLGMAVAATAASVVTARRTFAPSVRSAAPSPSVSAPVQAALPASAPAPAALAPVPSPPAPRVAEGPRPPKAGGLLVVRVYPWARVILDGVDRGVTPLAPIPVRAGEHEVLLFNEKLAVREVRKVLITPNRTTELKLRLSKH